MAEINYIPEILYFWNIFHFVWLFTCLNALREPIYTLEHCYSIIHETWRGCNAPSMTGWAMTDRMWQPFVERPISHSSNVQPSGGMSYLTPGMPEYRASLGVFHRHTKCADENHARRSTYPLPIWDCHWLLTKEHPIQTIGQHSHLSSTHLTMLLPWVFITNLSWRYHPQHHGDLRNGGIWRDAFLLRGSSPLFETQSVNRFHECRLILPREYRYTHLTMLWLAIPPSDNIHALLLLTHCFLLWGIDAPA